MISEATLEWFKKDERARDTRFRKNKEGSSTRREQIGNLRKQGYTLDAIAKELGITRQTVVNYSKEFGFRKRDLNKKVEVKKTKPLLLLTLPQGRA